MSFMLELPSLACLLEALWIQVTYLHKVLKILWQRINYSPLKNSWQLANEAQLLL